MNKNEYVESIVINNMLVNVGQNDAGQCYFIEWVEHNELFEECCGVYNTDYQGYIEYKFGNPEKDCPYYDGVDLIVNETKNCDNRFKFGYCDKCKYQNREYSNFQDLVKLDIVDKRGNVKEKYSKYLMKREDGKRE